MENSSSFGRKMCFKLRMTAGSFLSDEPLIFSSQNKDIIAALNIKILMEINIFKRLSKEKKVFCHS
jgi:hypothetical protein